MKTTKNQGPLSTAAQTSREMRSAFGGATVPVVLSFVSFMVFVVKRFAGGAGPLKLERPRCAATRTLLSASVLARGGLRCCALPVGGARG